MNIGHNSIAAEQLKSIVERIEGLEIEKKKFADAVKDVYADAKTRGYDVQVMRRLVGIRKQDQAKREEAEAILAVYMHAMGMSA